MPRREFLTPQKRSQLLAFPSDQAELIHLATLARDDLAFVRQRRGEHNRLGMAFLMVHLHSGRILGEEENRHDNLLSLVTAQLEIAPSIFGTVHHPGRDSPGTPARPAGQAWV